jgi:formate hydrogenlyase subunit 3/multisubunit Na+/H+ antiporter MnhD subunit
LGLLITTLLVASLAVEPFLYAALLIEVAVLLSIPLLQPAGKRVGKGLLRFLIYQTLAMPLILFSGWLLAGVEANAGNASLVQQAVLLLGMGLALLLAVFPFSAWIPMLMQEVHPYSAGFLLWLFPTTAMIFGLGFLDQYTWLREASSLNNILQTVGLLMVASGGMLVTFQRHLGRIFGFAVIIEIGYSSLALSLGGSTGLEAFLLLLAPRILGLLVWGLALSVFQQHLNGLEEQHTTGAARILPLASVALVLANLSLSGMPLLAGFPIHQAIWERLARASLPLTLVTLLGSLGLFVAAVRTLVLLIRVPERTRWQLRESRAQAALFIASWLAFFLLGIFPQLTLSIWTALPAIFTHLGQ